MSSRDILIFSSRSPDLPPGQGCKKSTVMCERVGRPEAYARLAAIPGWRQVLSNFHVCPFTWRGKTYRTIEHAFQATKIGLENAAAAAQFTVDSGTDLGASGDGLAARKQRKMRRLSLAKLAAWNAFSPAMMAMMAEAKYAQCPVARRVLLATNDAQLWHTVARSKPVRFVHLERIRSKLRHTDPAAWLG